MTQLFDDKGNVVPVTVIQAGPCVVVDVRTPARDGYGAIQVGFELLPERKVRKPIRGVFAKAKLAPHKVVREFRIGEGDTYTVGQELTVGAFAAGDLIDVVGTSKGHGFSGAMKRHNFSGQRDSHGVSLMHRAVGSLGISQVARVWPGKRMPGRYGGARITVKRLSVVQVDPAQGLLVISGAVPGPRGSLLMIRKRS